MELTAWIVFVCTCVASSNAHSMYSDQMTLQLVQVLFRHGARTPSIEEAKHVNATHPPVYYPEGYYELTNEGKRQTYRLGSLLRKKYDDFLGAYNPNDIYAYSTKSSRTKMSLQLVLAGLYTPASSEQWHPQLHWRPIPITQGTNFNLDLTIPHQCEKFVEVYNNETANSEIYQHRIAKYSDFIKFISKVTGINFEDNLTYHSGWAYISLEYHVQKNLTLPIWYTDDVLQKLRELYALGLDSMSLTEKLKKLNGGSIIRIFLENIDENKKASQPKKIYLYSNHDTTVSAFVKAQNISSFDIPPYGSAIIVEKYKDSLKREYIRILSWNGADEDFVTLGIPNCSEYCPLEEYKKTVEKIIPTDEDWDFLLDNPKESANKFDTLVY